MYDIGFHFCAAPHCVCNESCQRLVWHVRMSYSRCAWHGFRFCVAPASVRSASCHTCMRHVTSALSLSWVMSHLQESCHTCIATVMSHEAWVMTQVWHDSWVMTTCRTCMRHATRACVMTIWLFILCDRTRSFLGLGFRPLYPSLVWFVPLFRTKRVFWISTGTRPRS